MGDSAPIGGILARRLAESGATATVLAGAIYAVGQSYIDRFDSLQASVSQLTVDMVEIRGQLGYLQDSRSRENDMLLARIATIEHRQNRTDGRLEALEKSRQTVTSGL